MLKIERMLLFCTIGEFDTTVRPPRVRHIITVKYPVPIFDELMIEVASDTLFVDQDQRPIGAEELFRRMWKYHGPQGEALEAAMGKGIEGLFNALLPGMYDPTYRPLEGFWAYVTGSIESISGGDIIEEDDESRDPFRERAIVGLDTPDITLKATVIEFEVNPRLPNLDFGEGHHRT